MTGLLCAGAAALFVWSGCAASADDGDEDFDTLSADLKGSSNDASSSGSGSSGSGSSGSGSSGSGSSGSGTGGSKPLSSVAVPKPVGGDIVDQAAAVRLGKALFWDVQVGGDGQTACASCHYHAGTDNRTRNTIHPGANGTFDGHGVSAAGQTWDGSSLFDTDDRVGSQGVAAAHFLNIDANIENAADSCAPDAPAAPFFAERRVTGRNTPTAIGAVFFRDNFWDGRANNTYNGKNPFGLTGNNADGSFVTVTHASLASQASGPANNEVEMSCLGRPFNGPGSLGTKLLARKPLGKQLVSQTDSVLGSLSSFPAAGLATTYTDLVRAAFGAALAQNAEAQFSRIWGQAVAAYEATLVPGDTPFDRFLAGNSKALSAQQQKGLNQFNGKGQCNQCHAGSELSDATESFAALKGLINEDGGDQGFHNIGVTPTSEDLGRMGSGPQGVPFSVSRAVADRGAFKTPALRNVKLTAPYFHNGAFATLEDVVDFYNRGGDFDNREKAKRIKAIGMSADEKTALVDFLRNGLTDCRVEKERAPFDHPALPLPNGTPLAAIGANGTGTCP